MTALYPFPRWKEDNYLPSFAVHLRLISQGRAFPHCCIGQQFCNLKDIGADEIVHFSEDDHCQEIFHKTQAYSATRPCLEFCRSTRLQ